MLRQGVTEHPPFIYFIKNLRIRELYTMITPTEDISNLENDECEVRSMNSKVACDLFKRSFLQ